MFIVFQYQDVFIVICNRTYTQVTVPYQFVKHVMIFTVITGFINNKIINNNNSIKQNKHYFMKLLFRPTL